MRFKNYVARSILVLLVLASLVLSFFIWTSNQSLEQEKYEDPVTTNENNARNDQNFARIFLPTQVINYQNNQNYVLLNQGNDLIGNLVNKMKSWSLKPSQRQTLDAQSYFNRLANQNNIQIAYTDLMSLNAFAEIIDKPDFKQSEDFTFNRIFIPKDLDNHIYFANDQTKEIYQIERGGYDNVELNKFVDDYGVKLPIKFLNLNNRYVFDYLTQPQLSVYSYVIYREPEYGFVHNLLGDNNGSPTTTNSITTYKSGSSKRLTVDQNKDQLQYSDISVTNIPKNYHDLFDVSFNSISSLKTRLVEWRYYSSEIENGSSQIIYRNYVEGLPVFSQSDKGVASVNFGVGGETMSFTNQMLQVPIPPDGKVATLPSTKELLDKLSQSGYSRDQIQDIELGFEWQKDSINNNLIDLVPTYYVKVNDQMVNYENLLQTTAGNAIAAADK